MKKKVEQDLFAMRDEQYLKFHQKILNDEIKIIGVRIPLLRNYAKELKKENTLAYWIGTIKEDYYEEILLKGILIGLYKNITWEELEQYTAYYVAKITNWALCDTFCSGLKITKKYKNEMWKVIQKYLKSDKEFDVRFALVMLLNYYIDEEHIEEIFSIINHVKVDAYYTKMANAWLISYCFMRFYDETLKFYQTNCYVDEWTYHKGIQKSIESYRLTQNQKEELKLLKN